MYFPNLTATVAVTSTQIKSMFTNPVLLVPGKTGCIVDLKSSWLVYHKGTIVYNPGAQDGLVFITGVLPNAFLNYVGDIVQAQGFCDQTTDQIIESPGWWISDASHQNSNPLSDVIGSGIYLWQYNALGTYPNGANWTLGNGTFTAYLEYAYIVA